MGAQGQNMNGMNPQMMNQAQRAMMAQQMGGQQGQGQGGNSQQQAHPLAQLNQQINAIMTGIPQPVAQRLMQMRQEGQNQIAQQEQIRKTQFLNQFQQQGISPPQDQVNQWQ